MITPALDPGVLTKFYRGLGDPSRLAILTRLQQGEQTSGEVATCTGLSPSNASRHLACLRECGLIESRQEWRTVYYRLAGGVSSLLERNAALAGELAERIGACANPAMNSLMEDDDAAWSAGKSLR
ncbi:transcriptional regulator [bacterium]|nr:MAG: transcriptional regulator [bacterium]